MQMKREGRGDFFVEAPPAWSSLFYSRTFYANCHGTDNNYAHYPFHSVEDADRECEKVTEREETEREAKSSDNTAFA